MCDCTLFVPHNSVNVVTQIFKIFYKSWGRNSSVGIAHCYGLDARGSSPSGDEFYCTLPDRPWDEPILLYNVYRVFPGGIADGAWRWTPTPCTAEVKESIELYLYSPSWFSWAVTGWNSPLALLSTSPILRWLETFTLEISLFRLQ
jgi:hypothetical protein